MNLLIVCPIYFITKWMDKIFRSDPAYHLASDSRNPWCPSEIFFSQSSDWDTIWVMGMVFVMPLTDQFDWSVPVMLQLRYWNNKSIVSYSNCCISFFQYFVYCEVMQTGNTNGYFVGDWHFSRQGVLQYSPF